MLEFIVIFLKSQFIIQHLKHSQHAIKYMLLLLPYLLLSYFNSYQVLCTYCKRHYAKLPTLYLI